MIVNPECVFRTTFRVRLAREGSDKERSEWAWLDGAPECSNGLIFPRNGEIGDEGFGIVNCRSFTPSRRTSHYELRHAFCMST